jgi:hypothetical protein
LCFENRNKGLGENILKKFYLKVGAAVSRQSSVIASRQVLADKEADIRRQHQQVKFCMSVQLNPGMCVAQANKRCLRCP